MEAQLLKINIISIAVAGFLLLVTGLSLYLFRDLVTKYIRFLLPLPPIGVAAYIFVFNLFKDHDGNLPCSLGDTLRELITATAIVSIVFFGFIEANVLI